MENIVILGSTGSIGRQALDVIAAYPDEYNVVGLSAFSNAVLLKEQAAALPGNPKTALASGIGLEGILELCRLKEADTVINALVGSAGLRPTLESLKAGKRLLLSNKESLVAGGELVMRAARAAGCDIIPIDSEHSAIFQCLTGENMSEVKRIIITASGGPFRGRTRAQLLNVTVEDALAHPRWTMGPKITIDSATLMNKGLEVIEAHFLFGLPYEQIDVVVHPQSIVHSLVEFVDGSVLSQLGPTDMRLPIQYALTYPTRRPTPAGFIDLIHLGKLTFEAADRKTFPCLEYGYEAGRRGGTYPAAVNAANEEAVTAFLKADIGLSDIPAVIEEILESHTGQAADSIEAIENAEKSARAGALAYINTVTEGWS
ncbi:MAG: 1-deoxy-D-xylulose-5-phosphate reductoisomerase [Actinomycetota bacterium]